MNLHAIIRRPLLTEKSNIAREEENLATFAVDPHWSDDGDIVYHDFKGGGVMAIPARGGTPHTVVEKRDDEIHMHGGAPLPGGKGVLFSPHPLSDAAKTICVSTADGGRLVLFESDKGLGGPRYSPTGHILFLQNEEPRGIWAVPFALDRLEVTGAPFLVLSKVSSFSLSRTGDLVYSKQQSFGGRGSNHDISLLV